jgi:DNA primase
MYQEGLSYKGAINKLQDLTGHELKPVLATTSLKVFKEMQSLGHEDEPVVREILPESYLDQFEIIDGEPHEWIEEGILPETMRKYGIRIDTKGNRIVYGVYDANGNLIGAKGRTRFASYELLGIKKYCNYCKVGTTDYFQGMKENLPNIKAKKSMIVVEGLKSVMKIDQWGYDTGVAAECSYLNDAQAKIIIASGCEEVIFAFDQDVTYADALKSANKVKKWTNCYVMIDRKGLLKPKDSPCDEGREVWEQLYNERVRVI